MGFLKKRIWTWGYVLDKVPTAAPFTFEKTRCSLETQTAYLGAEKTFYMNTMFSREYIEKKFKAWDPEIIGNCIENRLSDMHLQRLKSMKEIFCTLEHENYLESALRIAKASLIHKNIKGIHFDDFSRVSGGKILGEIHDRIKEINPALKIAIVTYSNWDPAEYEGTAKYVDLFSRWCWVPSEDYWRQHREDIRKLRDITGPDKTILQGIYIHDFGSSGLPVTQCLSKVPKEVFQLSVETICENTWNGTIDGIILPQAAYFSCLSHKSHVSWLKEYIDWFDGTTTEL
ncbi:MAG: hypothetical protein IJW05_09300 [Lentisphaeria bacterium]|nr:hypothetical protein [Lentisphaeria bacterium]